MNYSEYPGHKTFVVQHTTGFGDQGGEPIRYHEIRGSFDTYEEALGWGRIWYPADPSGWTYDSFDIHVNSLTEKGKLIMNQWEMESEIRQMRVNEHPERYYIIDTPDLRLIMEKNAMFDSPSLGTKPALESYRMVFLDTTDVEEKIRIIHSKPKTDDSEGNNH